MRITFLGGAGTVTGSCYLVEIDGRHVLLDCGQFQGTRAEEARNREPFPIAASDVDAVVLSHAHIDHSGRLPLLRKQGYRGPIYTHPASCALAEIMLRDAGYQSGAELGPITVNGTGLGAGPAVEVWRRELDAEIAIETMDFGDYITLLPERPPQVFTINWITDYPSPYALYGLLLLPDAASNYGHWTDPAFDDLMQAAAEAEDPDDQLAAYLAVEDRVDEEAPVIPWSWDVSHWLVREGLNGVGTLTVGLLDFGRVSWAD